MTTNILHAALRSVGLEPTIVPTEPHLLPLEEFDLAELVDDVKLSDQLYEQNTSAFLAIGQPGTPIINGQLQTEPNPYMRPTLARGSYGQTGVFDELLRENGVHKAVSSLSNLIATGVFSLEWPDGARDMPNFKDHERAANELFRKMLSADWDDVIDNLCSGILRGFALFEVVYNTDAQGRLYPEEFGFREQSTVSRWVLDPYGRDLLAVQFDSFYSDGEAAKHNYTLPVLNRNRTIRVMLSSVGRVGLNFEGLSPVRTLAVLVDLKKLLLSIAGASNERFGCPVLASKHADATLAPGATGPSDAAVQTFNRVLNSLQALDTPTLHIPKGLDMLYLSPEGQPADVVPMLNYIDSQIASALATQAQQLGHSGVGSYALAAVQDNDLLRAAPAYARYLLKGPNKVFRSLLASDYGVPRFYLPSLVWAAKESIDNSKWLSDLERLSQMAPKLPPEVLRQACAQLGISPDAFEGQR